MFCVFVFSSNILGQEFLVNGSDGRLAKIDINGCVDEYIATIGSFTDIAAHPDGFIYAIQTDGDLFRIDLVSAGVSPVVELPGNIFYALTANADGTLFAATAGGALVSYNTWTGEIITYPNIGEGASGDLTYYKGQLYMATFSNTIISVHPESPEKNEVVIDFNDAGVEIFGIVSSVIDCEVHSYAISGDFGARVFEIGWETKTFNEVCTSDLRIFGGSSEFEFKASEDALSIDEYDWQNTLCDGADVSVQIYPKGVGSEIEFSLDNVNFQESNEFTGLTFGKHYLYMRDNLGCEGVDSFIIEPGNLEVELFEANDSRCEDGQGMASINVSSNAATYNFTLNGEDREAENLLTGLEMGSYLLEVRDSDGCNETIDFEIDFIRPDSIVEEFVENATCGASSGRIEIEASGTDNIYILEGERKSRGIFENLASGNYELLIEDDKGCRISRSYSIVDDDDCNLFIPNIFSPNQDGVNDRFAIFSDEVREIEILSIFDRWGSKVHESRNFMIGDDTLGWDGTVNGGNALEGIYTYYLRLKTESRKIEFSGSVNLKR